MDLFYLDEINDPITFYLIKLYTLAAYKVSDKLNLDLILQSSINFSWNLMLYTYRTFKLL